MIENLVYILCALASLLCAGLLYRHFRATRAPLLFWSMACFVCLGLTNILLCVDKIVLPEVDISLLRHAVTLAGMMMLLYGLIMERS